jgi:hypothetical protein
LSEPALGPDAAARLAERLWRLDERASVRDLHVTGNAAH